MKSYRLGPKQRLLIEAGLREHYEMYRDVLLRYDSHFYLVLGHMLQQMRELGLHSFEGRTYAQWRALYRYVGRVGVMRSVRYDYSADSSETIVARGGPLLTSPELVSVLLKLTSLDERQALVCVLGGGSKQLAYAPPADLKMPDGRFTLRCRILERHRHTGSDNRNAHRCLTCYSANCNRHFNERRMGRRCNEASEAYMRSGLEGLWHFMDGLWIEWLLKRPVPHPLSLPSLSVRCEVHEGQLVTVVTTSGSISGKLYTHYDEGWLPQVLTLVQKGVGLSIQPDTVIDIVPAQAPLP